MCTVRRSWYGNMINIAIFLSLFALGFFVGRYKEARHFSDLQKRETALAYITTSNIKHVPEGMNNSVFVSGNVVVSIDYYKRILAALRGIFGGQIKSYTSLVERARREAVLRMKEQAEDFGMHHISNLKLETASVYKNSQNSLGSIEIFAYGTALK